MNKASGSQVSYDTAALAVKKAQTLVMMAETAAAFDARMAFEILHRPGNASIQAKLTAAKSKLTSAAAANVMIAVQMDPGFVNRTVGNATNPNPDGERRYNVYAFDKLADLLVGMDSGVFHNAVNLAVMKSMFKFRAAGVAFSGVAAQAAVSDKVKVDKAMEVLLVRHTVSAATAPTQVSSTMNALQTLGVAQNTGSVKHPVWTLTDTPVVRHIQALIAA
jgi:hypothetical protein